jgi:hypothetical protein
MRAHLLLANGVLTLADFDGRTAQGRLVGYFQLNGRGKEALWTADLRALGVDLSHWLRLRRSDAASPAFVSGKLDALVQVKGSGRSTAEILASLGGDVRAHVREGSICTRRRDAGPRRRPGAGAQDEGGRLAAFLCNVVDLDVAGGVAKPKVFVVNTTDSTVFVDGSLSLKTEAMDLRAVVSPKDFSPPTLRTPILVRGTLGQPAVSVDAKKVVAKAAAATLLGVLVARSRRSCPSSTPVADAAKETAARCADMVGTSGNIQAATRVPKNAPVPPPPNPTSAAAARGESASALALVADELAFAPRMRLADLLGLLHLLGLGGRIRRCVARCRLDLARVRKFARRLVVAPAGFVVAFALDLVLLRGLGCHRVSPGGCPPDKPGQAAARLSSTSSVTTSKRSRLCGPKHIVIGTSPASRPRAMTMRPMRRRL